MVRYDYGSLLDVIRTTIVGGRRLSTSRARCSCWNYGGRQPELAARYRWIEANSGPILLFRLDISAAGPREFLAEFFFLGQERVTFDGGGRGTFFGMAGRGRTISRREFSKEAKPEKKAREAVGCAGKSASYFNFNFWGGD